MILYKKFSKLETAGILLRVFPHVIKIIDLSDSNITSLDSFDLSKVKELNLNNCESLPAEEFLMIKDRCPQLTNLHLS